MDQPSIILIILDSARRDMFGCYGSNLGLTPNFDRLASEGMLLWDHYAAGCGSAQAHVSTFTGQHSARHRMVHNLCEVRDDLLAMPRLLRELGYRTYGHSKASFIPPAGHEDLFGFDEMWYSGKASARARSGGVRDHALDLLRRWPWAFNTAKRLYGTMLGRERQLEASARYFDGHASFRYLRDRLAEHHGSAPVFAYSTILHPHTPYYPPKRYLDRFFHGRPVPAQALDIQANFHAYANGDFGEAREGIEALKLCYQADLVYGDEQLGQFADDLAERGILDESVLIVTSDHGELFGEHGLANHGASVWEQLYSTPCLIRYPKAIPAGTVVRGLTSALDLMPTAFSLIGKEEWLADRTTLDGEPLRLDTQVDPDRALIVDAPPAVLPERFKQYPKLLYLLSIIARAARTSEFKYIWQSNGQKLLFRTGTPEDDQHNVLEEYPEIADDLHSRMVAFYEAVDPEFVIEQYPVAIGRTAGALMTNPAVRQELKRLGYM